MDKSTKVLMILFGGSIGISSALVIYEDSIAKSKEEKEFQDCESWVKYAQKEIKESISDPKSYHNPPDMLNTMKSTLKDYEASYCEALNGQLLEIDQGDADLPKKLLRIKSCDFEKADINGCRMTLTVKLPLLDDYAKKGSKPMDLKREISIQYEREENDWKVKDIKSIFPESKQKTSAVTPTKPGRLEQVEKVFERGINKVKFW